jgi:hypothetical protein
MRAITEREKRTIRFAAIILVAYLVLFFGLRVVRNLETQRSDYQRLVVEAQRLKRDLLPYENRVLLAEKFKENYRMNPAKLTRSTIVAEASAAIQKAASSGKVQLGPMREAPARASAKELTSIQLEASGQVAAVISMLHRLPTLGFPLMVDSVQITPESKPGNVKLSLTVIILDAEQWLKEPIPNA